VIAELIQQIEEKGVSNSSTFSGLAGINFSVFVASKNKTRYSKLLDDLNRVLLCRIEEEYILPWQQFIEKNLFIPPRFWDVITGISGILAYLLHFLENPAIHECALKLIRLLSRWGSSKKLFQEQSVPAFFTPAELLLRSEHQFRYQPGCIDTGIAHGISGVLGILSKAAKLDGEFAEICQQTVQTIGNWLVDHLQRSQINYGKIRNTWPSRFVLSLAGKDQFDSVDLFYRDGWCYGAIGIARALFLAFEAVGERSFRDISFAVFESVLERFPELSGLQCPSFCHGFSGFLTILYNMFLDTKEEKFFQASHHAAQILIDCYNPSFSFGFQTLATQLGEDEIWIDNPGILDGAAGVVLALNLLGSSEKQIWTDLFIV